MVYLVKSPPSIQQQKQPNYVSTTKYTWWAFLPIALIIQFRRYANIYFLVCAILQSIPLISPLSPFSAVAPLIFVLSLSILREGYEDYKRWVSDRISNNTETHLLHLDGSEHSIAWKDVIPGTFLKISKNQTIPADLIPLYCSNPDGLVFIQTSSLDGEKNLKPKFSIPKIQQMANFSVTHQRNDDPHRIKAENSSSVQFEKIFAPKYEILVECDPPNDDLNRFEASFQLNKYTKQEPKAEILNEKHLLYRGCKLKNTQWIIGLTVYTGKRTKVMMNGCLPSSKCSNIQQQVNIIILFVLAFEILCSLLSALFCLFSCYQTIAFQSYLESNKNCSQLCGISFGSYFILYSTFIPISLIVSLEFVKVFQGYAMSIDKEMYCQRNGRSMECHTVSINEELGQIEYIFTDKTGTLTKNEMEFKCMQIGYDFYGEALKKYVAPLNFDYSSLSIPQNGSYRPSRKTLSGKKKESSQGLENRNLKMMMLIMTTCHDCLPSSSKFASEPKSDETDENLVADEHEDYEGPSPDEVALLRAAKLMGWEFISKSNQVIRIKASSQNLNLPAQVPVDYEVKILKVFPFDPTRKMMSIIAQFEQKLFLFVKGADTSIATRLRLPQPYLREIQMKSLEMASAGLRTLWFAYRELPATILSSVNSLSAQELETELNLLGCTAIQDKLQDYVGQTIYALREGGIKFVMLTGDKLETAQNIGKSCRLIGETSILVHSFEELKNAHQRIGCSVDNSQKVQTTQNSKTGQAATVVLDGSKINFSSEEVARILKDLLIKCPSIICCRVTPPQKARIVLLAKQLGKRTLAVGDGANDVNMILAADVGVGIFGYEGTNAVQVANYAIGEFCLLWKLLLYYGRLNYIRISEMILYFFYKNLVFTSVQLVYAFYNLGSGQSFWLSWSITFYNMIFTFFPVVLRAVFEVDLSISSTKKEFSELASYQDASEARASVRGENLDNENKEAYEKSQKAKLYRHYPKMYIIGQKNQVFTAFAFFGWFTLGILQGICCLLITLYSMGSLANVSGINSYETGFYFCEISAYTSVIIVVTLKLALNVRNWNWILVAGFLIPSLGAYILYCYLMNIFEFSFLEYYVSDLLLVPNFYLVQCLTILGMFSIDLLLFSLQATKANFVNYLKYRTLRNRRLSTSDINRYWLEMTSPHQP